MPSRVHVPAPGDAPTANANKIHEQFKAYIDEALRAGLTSATAETFSASYKLTFSGTPRDDGGLDVTAKLSRIDPHQRLRRQC